MSTITVFDGQRIKNAYMRVLTGDVAGTAKQFACMATLSSETEVREVIKKCPESGASESRAIPVKHTVTLAGRFPADVIRDVFGLDSKGLRAGVYGYGPTSSGKNFIFVAEVEDEFEGVIKKIAYPKCVNITGLAHNLDNEADEYAYAEMEIVANAVTIGGTPRFYVEAFVGEAPEAITDDWNNFEASLVAGYVVTYDGNGNTGGTAPVDATVYAAGASVTVAAAGTLTLTAKTFDGWNTLADGSGTDYAAAATMTMPDADVTLYAQWI